MTSVVKRKNGARGSARWLTLVSPVPRRVNHPAAYGDRTCAVEPAIAVRTSTKRRIAVGAKTARSHELCGQVEENREGGVDRPEPGKGGHESPRSVLERTLAHARQNHSGHHEQDRAGDRGQHQCGLKGCDASQRDATDGGYRVA